MDLDGRVALVTGGSRGLGLLIARELRRRGARVAICARSPDELERAARLLKAEEVARNGPRQAQLEPPDDGQDWRSTWDRAHVMTIEADVSDRSDVEAMFARIRGRWGPVEILVNNASLIEVGPVSSMSEDDFRRIMEVNFWGTLNTILAALPEMRARREGRIVNITSIGARVPMPHLLPYVCAKFAAVGLSEGLHAELGPDGIGVTTVVPGLMRTGSPVHAQFRGDPEREYAWFAVSSSTRLTSMSADRAARRIVRAAERGRSVVTLGWQARLAAVAHGIAPGTVSHALAGLEHLLPPARDDGRSGTRSPVPGGRIFVPPMVARMTRRMREAAMRNNELTERP